MANGEEGADQIDAQDLLPVLDGLLEQGHHAAADAGIREQHIKTAEGRHGPLDIGDDIRLRAAVRHPGVAFAMGRLDGSDRLVNAGFVLVDREDARPLLGEEDGTGPADAAAGARHDRTLAFEPSHTLLPRSRH